MNKTYRTIQGDMWDKIAYEQMGSVLYTDQQVLGPSSEIIATGGSVTTDPDYYPRALWLLPDERDSGDFPF